MPHPRITDDKFVLHVEVKDDNSVNAAATMLKESGASEVLLKSLQSPPAPQRGV